MVRPVLVMGFGPFRDITVNPSARVAGVVDGAVVGAVPIVGVDMPVSYERGPARTLELVARHDPRLVLGLGVAADRQEITVERWGRRVDGAGGRDVDGSRWEPSEAERAAAAALAATIDVEALAAGLGGRVSEDAGTYVCNAWLYRVRCRLGESPPVGFVHLPLGGIEPERLLRGIAALLAADDRVG